jgi:hypothetical protein
MIPSSSTIDSNNNVVLGQKVLPGLLPEPYS